MEILKDYYPELKLNDKEKIVVAEYEYVTSLQVSSRRPRMSKNKRKYISNIGHKVFGIVIARHLYETANRPGFARRLLEKQK